MNFAKVVLAVTLALAGAAQAHPDHDDDVVVYRLDAARNNGSLVLYLNDRGVKIPTAGATGKLAWDKGSATLQPVGMNGLEVKGTTLPAAGTKAQAHITFADKSTFMTEVVIK